MSMNLSFLNFFISSFSSLRQPARNLPLLPEHHNLPRSLRNAVCVADCVSVAHCDDALLDCS